VYGQRYDSNGMAAGGEFRINTFVNNVQNDPSVRSLADGGFLVVWSSALQNGGSGIYAQRYDADGNTVGGEFRVPTHQSVMPLAAEFSVLSNGDIAACWRVSTDYGEYSEIFGVIFDTAGVARSPEFRVSENGAAKFSELDVVALDSGEFLVTWARTVGSSETDLVAQRFSADGIKQGPLLTVNPDGTYALYPSVAVLEDGNVVFGWLTAETQSALSATYGRILTFDTREGTSGAELILGRSFADTLMGAGGADTLRGLDGNDTLIVPDTAFAVVDGGAGMDTLKITGGGRVLDLRTKADSAVTGFECIDITGTGNNTLKLNLAEVLNISPASDTLQVRGNAGDKVYIGTGWTAAGGETVGADYYLRYEHSTAVLLIDNDMNVI
jgi:Ca2+-binding RTX toxin-like protein